MPFVTETAGPPSVMADAVDVGDGQAVAIDIAVVAENVDRDGAIFGDREAVVLSDRRIVDRRHRADDRRHRRDRAVGDRVREERRAVVVRRRCEHQLARHQSHRAVGHATAGPPSVIADAVDVGDRQAVAIDVASLPRTSTVIEPSSATVKLSF